MRSWRRRNGGPTISSSPGELARRPLPFRHLGATLTPLSLADPFPHMLRLYRRVLVPRASPTTTTEILTHCETFRRAAFSIAPGSAELKEVTAYGIASVYTPEQYRKRGYGKRMLQLLHCTV